MNYKIDFNYEEWESPMNGLRFKQRTIGNQHFRLVEYSKEMTPHWCENGHVGYMLEGEMEVRFDNDSLVFSAGNGIKIPSGPNYKHMAIIKSEIVKVIYIEAI